MPVYFVREGIKGPIKIGRAAELKRRVGQLQTSNPVTLQLLGWLVAACDIGLERDLHSRYANHRLRGEWFSISQDEVLRELQRSNGFVPKRGDAFEIISYDKDGVPEYAGVCSWADLEFYECCPFCGCLCGMHQVSEYPLHSCMNCGEILEFSGPGASEA